MFLSFAGKDMYMQEVKKRMFWVLTDFIIFIFFDNARKHENEQNRKRNGNACNGEKTR